MFNRERLRVWRILQYSALTAGATCLLWVGTGVVRAELFDRQHRAQFERETGMPVEATRNASLPSSAAPGDVIGVLEIPRLGFSELVVHGDDDNILKVAIGHLPDTPLPWQPGNSAMAGHRDGHFRPLKDVQQGDVITLQTHHGTLRYVLRTTKIVTPDDLSVLTPTESRTLTLITCYPFSYIGNAPKRFIITAEAADEISAQSR